MNTILSKLELTNLISNRMNNRSLFPVILVSLLFFQVPSLAQHAHLYGLGSYGGTRGQGNLFRFTPTTNELSIEFSFPSEGNGNLPLGTELVDGGNGKFYGVASRGGIKGGSVIFEWDPVANLYTKKGDFIVSGALSSYNGKFYGTTSGGGVNDSGYIFEWDPNTNIYVQKVDFGSITDGPNNILGSGPLVLAGGKFYGVTRVGGFEDQSGTLYEWDPVTNILTMKYNFPSIADGQRPFGYITALNDKLYGVTQSGGAFLRGVIFEWDISTNTYTKKIDNFGAPRGALSFFDGKFYALTNYGEIIEWNPVTNGFTIKKTLPDNGDVNVAQILSGSLTLVSNKFYGMRPKSIDYPNGTLFEWDPVNNDYVDKVEFDGVSKGSKPLGSLSVLNGKLYGMTSEGGINNVGTIFEYNPSSGDFIKKKDFVGQILGSAPFGSLTFYNGKLYGMTSEGGLHNKGVIFEWDPISKTFTKKIDFDGESKGSTPFGNNLTMSNGKFYGMTTYGGINNDGVIFEWDPLSNIFTKKIDFDRLTKGSNPNASLVLFQNKFYGTLVDGGTNYAGVIFEWNPTSNNFTKKFEFSSDETLYGRSPQSNLSLLNDKFYGFIGYGGLIGSGVLFEWDPVSNNYQKKFDFDGVSGSGPFGSLSLLGDRFYGLTESGGGKYKGVLFEWIPDSNEYIKRLDFNSTDRSFPIGTLTLSNDKFYGMTQSGTNRYGGIFEWNHVVNSYTKKADFTVETDSPFGFDIKLTEIQVENQLPTLSNLPGTQTKCQMGQTGVSGEVTFTFLDGDLDLPTFSAVSNNTTLVANSGISVSSVNGNNYKVNFITNPSQSGSSLITITANDGYGGTVSFDFTLTILAQPATPTVDINTSDPENPMLTSSASASNQWFLNGNAINGANSNKLTVTQPGAYSVQVTSNGCVSEFSSNVDIVITGDLKGGLGASASIYPNPVIDYLTISLGGFEKDKPVSIMIVDLNGRTIEKVSGQGLRDTRIDVRMYSPGRYLAILQQCKKKLTMSFIKSDK